jgi:hypothetical protein
VLLINCSKLGTAYRIFGTNLLALGLSLLAYGKQTPNVQPGYGVVMAGGINGAGE